MEFNKVLETRRSNYTLDKKVKVDDAKIKALLQEAVLHTPTGFNSQSGRVVLLLNKNHDALWKMIKEALRKVTPADQFKTTNDKINAFNAAYGTVLFFEDQAVVTGLMKEHPLYAANFPVWSLESAGMLQLAVWGGMAQEGLAASLQHYSELIEGDVKKTFDIPANWKLIAQMPFGNPIEKATKKTFEPLEKRLIVKS